MMMEFRKAGQKFLVVLMGFAISNAARLPVSAQGSEKIKDFRGTAQSLALLGTFSEFVDPDLKQRYVNQLRKLFNRYSRSYGESSISNFKLALNPNEQYFRPITGVLSESQKQFYKAAQKDNSVDIFVLSSLTETGEGLDLELQLYDARIETLSAVERVVFQRAQEERSFEDVVYRLMNYIDRDGFVHPNPQEILEKPILLQSGSLSMNSGVGGREFSISPEILSGEGVLAGRPTIGGEKTPFWETWWFWSIIGGTLVSTGGLTYYLTVVDEPPSRANIRFRNP
jgi:hypothetical protein